MINQTNKILWLSQLLFFLAVFFKQFYIFPSGGLQIGDILFISSFCGLFLSGKMKKNHFIARNFLYVVFLVCVCTINLLHFIIYESNSFLMSSMYYIYNYIVMYTFLQFMDYERFLKGFSTAVKFAILSQLVIRFFKLGRWYMGYRYMGTFNDPNQFAFYIFAALLLLVIVDFHIKNQFNYLWTIIAAFLVFESASMGALLGVFILCVGDIIISTNSKRVLVFKLLILSLIVFMLTVGLIGQLPDFITTSEAYTRLIQKIDKYGLGSNVNIFDSMGAVLDERGWYRLVDYPQKIIYGSGEGVLSRFGGNLEIHSSVFSILFYYGIFPTSCLAIWVINKLKNLNRKYVFVYLAFFVEAIFLNNTRQPFFWILLILISLEDISKKRYIYMEENQ